MAILLTYEMYNFFYLASSSVVVLMDGAELISSPPGSSYAHHDSAQHRQGEITEQAILNWAL